MKRIKMEYIKDDKKINDGKTHDIMPNLLYAFKIDGYQFFFLKYKDLDYNIECKTILTQDSGVFNKMELDCDESKIIEGENLIKLDCSSLPSIINKGSYLDTKEIIKHKTKSKIEKIEIDEPTIYDCIVIDNVKLINSNTALLIKDINNDDLYTKVNDKEINELKKLNYIPKYIKNSYIDVYIINNKLYLNNISASNYLDKKTNEKLVYITRMELKKIEKKYNIKPIFLNEL